MSRLASLVLFLFVANLVFAAMGPHCAAGTLNSGLQTSAIHHEATHGHDDQHHPLPDQTREQGDPCTSMQLAAVLAGATVPSVPKVETPFVWMGVQQVVVVNPSIVEQDGLPPPPLISTDFRAVHARTGRLLI